MLLRMDEEQFLTFFSQIALHYDKEKTLHRKEILLHKMKH